MVISNIQHLNVLSRMHLTNVLGNSWMYWTKRLYFSSMKNAFCWKPFHFGLLKKHVLVYLFTAFFHITLIAQTVCRVKKLNGAIYLDLLIFPNWYILFPLYAIQSCTEQGAESYQDEYWSIIFVLLEMIFSKKKLT